MSRVVEIPQLVSERLHVGDNSIHIVPVNGGISNENYQVTTLDSESGNTHSYFLTLFPNKNDWWKIEKEKMVRHIAGPDSVEIFPPIHDTGVVSMDGAPVGYILRDYVEGQDLDKSICDAKEKNRPFDWGTFAEELGDKLALLHSQNIPTFGLIGPVTAFPIYRSWKAFILAEYETHAASIEQCAQQKIRAGINLDQIRTLMPSLMRNVYAWSDCLDEIVHPNLVHGDCRFANILADQRNGNLHVRGFIDTEWAVSGDPALDIAQIENWLFFSTYQEAFYKHKQKFKTGYTRRRPLYQQSEYRRQIYHGLRSLNYLRNIFLYQPDNFEFIDDRFSTYIIKHMDILSLVANGGNLSEIGIDPI